MIEGDVGKKIGNRFAKGGQFVVMVDSASNDEERAVLLRRLM